MNLFGGILKKISYFSQLVVSVFVSLLLGTSALAIETTPLSSFRVSGDNLYSMRYRFRIDVDPGDSAFVFWAQQFWIRNGPGGYLGLQRDAYATPYKKKVIFSIWDANESLAGSIKGAKAEAFGGEGEGQHILAPLDWKIGHSYAFMLSRVGDWWNVQITDEETQEQWDLGRIRGDSSWQELQPTVNAFTEVYFGNSSCEVTPYAKATFLPPSGNDGEMLEIPYQRSSYTYGDHSCAAASVPGAKPGENIGVLANNSKEGSVHEVGLFRGPQNWGDYDRKAKIGALFKYANYESNQTEYFELKEVYKEDKRYWYFPVDQSDNFNWTYLGTDYNGNTFLHQWGENDRRGKIGTTFVYRNPISNRTEYFQLKALGADGRYWRFPDDGTDNDYWTFKGFLRPEADN